MLSCKRTRFIYTHVRYKFVLLHTLQIRRSCQRKPFLQQDRHLPHRSIVTYSQKFYDPLLSLCLVVYTIMYVSDYVVDLVVAWSVNEAILKEWAVFSVMYLHFLMAAALSHSISTGILHLHRERCCGTLHALVVHPRIVFHFSYRVM